MFICAVTELRQVVYAAANCHCILPSEFLQYLYLVCVCVHLVLNITCNSERILCTHHRWCIHALFHWFIKYANHFEVCTPHERNTIQRNWNRSGRMRTRRSRACSAHNTNRTATDQVRQRKMKKSGFNWKLYVLKIEGGRAVMCAFGWMRTLHRRHQIYSNWKLNAINCVRKRFPIRLLLAQSSATVTSQSKKKLTASHMNNFCLASATIRFIIHVHSSYCTRVSLDCVWIGEINYWSRAQCIRAWRCHMRCMENFVGDDLSEWLAKSHGSIESNVHCSLPFRVHETNDFVTDVVYVIFAIFFLFLFSFSTSNYPIPVAIQFGRSKSHEQITINYMI